MKVTHKNINGDLNILGKVIQFIPDVNPYGPDRLTIIDAKVISFGGKEDDYGIFVSGYTQHFDDDGKELFEKVSWDAFYPRFKDMI